MLQYGKNIVLFLKKTLLFLEVFTYRILYIYCRQSECLNAIEILLYKGNAAQKNTGTKGYYKNKLFNL